MGAALLNLNRSGIRLVMTLIRESLAEAIPRPLKGPWVQPASGEVTITQRQTNPSSKALSRPALREKRATPTFRKEQVGQDHVQHETGNASRVEQLTMKRPRVDGHWDDGATRRDSLISSRTA